MNRPLRVALVVAALVGCATLGGRVLDDPARFPHDLHGEAQELACGDCHREASKSEAAGMPSSRQCQLCHEDPGADKPPEERAAAIFDGKNVRRAPGPDHGDLRFSHVAHVSKAVGCETCHAGAGRAEPEMDDCVECHTRRAVSPACETCHTEIRRDRAPASHDLSWERRHGDAVGEDGQEDQCGLCHQTSTCEACHRAEAPDSHNTLWRGRGHSVAAGFDRQSCRTCHQVDFCDGCHQSAAPSNHIAGWGSPGDRHCLGCHVEPGGDEGCGVCHRGALSHRASAPPRPPSHDGGMDCRRCHGSRQTLPHLDDGVPCLACHR